MHGLLKIAVVGAGQVGSAFAFALSRIGQHDVTVVARAGSRRLEQLTRDKGIVNLKTERANVRVLEELDDVAYDLVIVTVLAHQVGAIVPALIASRATEILFMFSNFEPENLEAALGAERCTFGMPFLMASIDVDGRLKAVIGTLGQKSLINKAHLVRIFNHSGLPAKLEANMPLWLRCHVPMTIAFESISVTAKRRGGGASWGDALTVAAGVRECFAVLTRLGYSIYPTNKLRMSRSPLWQIALMLWFMSRVPSFRDLLATGRAECEALIEAVLAAASDFPNAIASDRIRAMKPR